MLVGAAAEGALQKKFGLLQEVHSTLARAVNGGQCYGLLGSVKCPWTRVDPISLLLLCQSNFIGCFSMNFISLRLKL